MKDRQFLKAVYAVMVGYQSARWPTEPSELIARVILGIEKELQKETHDEKVSYSGYCCPISRRVL